MLGASAARTAPAPLRPFARARPALVLFAAALILAACGTSDDDGGPSSGGSGGLGGGAATGSSTAAGTTSTNTTASGAGGGGGAGGSSSSGAATDCAVDGIDGNCMDVSVCDAMQGYVSTAGFCPGPANIQCCTAAPTTVDNPPVPTGYQYMMQSEVTPEMTSWAVSILHDPIDYPMFSTALKTFGALTVLARVEWHPPDFQNDVVHRGVTLYEPI